MIVFVVIVALNLLTGYSVSRLLYRRVTFTGLRVEWWLLWFSFGALLNGWVAFVLAELSLFSLGLWVIILILVNLLSVWLWYGRAVQTAFEERALIVPLVNNTRVPYWVEYLLLVGWGIAAVFLFFRPHGIISGGADAGVYTSFAGYIARTGSLYIQNDVLAELDERLYPAFLRVISTRQGDDYYWSSGLIVPDSSGRILPPFYHLHPVWQAAAFTLQGVYGALLMSPLWMWWASVAVYATVRRLLRYEPNGWWLSFLALLTLSVCALQLWFARYSTTEALTQFLFWAGLWAFTLWSDTDYQDKGLGLLAGLAWGSTFLARIDTLFVLIIPFIFLVYLLYQKRFGRAQIPFFAALIILPLHSVAHALLFSNYYFFNVYGYMMLVAWQNLWWLLLAAVVGLAFVSLLWWQAASIKTLLIRIQPIIKTGSIVLLVGLFLYAWFVRPVVGAPQTVVNPWDNVSIETWNHENLVRLGWYLSPLGIVLAALGIIWLIWSANKRTWAYLVIGLLYSLLYIWDVRSNAIQIYAMRRYVPVVVPFFITVVTLFLAWLGSGRGRQLPLVLIAVLWLGNVAWLAQGFVTQVDLPTYPAEIARIAEQLPPDAIVLFNQTSNVGIGDHVGVPLMLIHGRNAFVLYHMDQLERAKFAETVAQWHAADYPVYWMQLPGGHEWPLDAAQLQPQFSFAIPVSYLESSYIHKPTEVEQVVWPADVFLVTKR